MHTNDISRRSVLGTAGLATLAVMGSGAAALAKTGSRAPALDPQGNPGVYHTRVGSIRVSVVTDGAFHLDPIHPTLGPNVDEAQFIAAVREYRIAEDGYMHIHSVLIQTADRKVLIDAGSGDTFAPGTGRLIANLRQMGVEASEITDILVTHAHLDHIGGLVLAGGAGDAFPNATVHIDEGEYSFWRSGPGLEKSYVPREMVPGFVKIANDSFDMVKDRLSMIRGVGEVLPGIIPIPTPGHTPGHVAFMISDGDEQLCFVGDTIFMAPVMPLNPDWQIAFDTDPALAAKTRFRFLDQLATDRVRICGSHLPFPAFGHLRREGGGFEYLPEMYRFG